MYIAILGRQPELSFAELFQVYGAVEMVSPEVARLDEQPDITRLGGTLKTAEIIAEFPASNWLQASRKVIAHYGDLWKNTDHKITLGVSAYGWRDVSDRDVQKTGIVLKQHLKKHGGSLRLIPNPAPSLTTASVFHNKLGSSDARVEIIIVRRSDGTVLVAETIGVQDIDSYTARDQARPKRDAFVGMLPPKLAQMMINLSGVAPSKTPARLLDPFCGTGVILQEALLLGYDAYGTDLVDKMVDYSTVNLDWLVSKFHLENARFSLEQGDAMTHQWRAPIDAVVCETYLGQPFSAPPSSAKLAEVRRNCNHIISTFLKNLQPQLKPGTPLCIAVPAWRGSDGRFTHLPLTAHIEDLGYEKVPLGTDSPSDLLYYREDQVVARELLVITRQ